MACITLTSELFAMATTQLERVVQNEYASPWQFESNVERSPLCMSWVVVTDSDGKPQLRMRWTSDC